MIRALVSIEVDLASSFAIRYACQLGSLIQMELHPVYVKSAPPEEPATGVGWAAHTWERELIAMGREEIMDVLSPEMDSCQVMKEPKVIYGDRQAELSRLMEEEAFDLYLEGAPYPLNPVTISKRLNTRFYQRLNCPIIWLRALKKIDRAFLFCLDASKTKTLAEAFLRLFSGCKVPLHLGFPTFAGEGLRGEVAKAEERLAARGCQVVVEEPLPLREGGPPLEVVGDYGLLALGVDRAMTKDSPLLEWLSKVRTPLMLVFDQHAKG